MPILKVMVNKLSSDWQVARAVLEDGYKAIGTTSTKIRTRYEFVAHLLDVHRMSCAVCPNPGALGVRSDRDTAVGGSAAPFRHVRQRMRKYMSASTQTTDRFHLDAPDRGLNLHVPDNNGDGGNININEMAFPLAMTFNGEDEELQADAITSEEKSSNEKGTCIKQERHDDESIREKNIEQREEDAVEGWLDNDEQSNLERTIQLSYLLIKEEGASQEYCNIDVNSSTCESASHQRHEEAIPTQDSRSDLLCHLERPSQLSNLHIKQEGTSQEHCHVDMGSRNEATFYNRQEEAFPAQDIGYDEKTILDSIIEPSTSTHNYDVCSPEGSSQEQCDTDWKTAVDEISASSGSTHSRDVQISECSSQDVLLAGMDTSKKVQNTSRSDRRKPSQCPSCSKKYSCKRAFHEHLRTHSDIYKKVQSISRCEPKPQSQRTLTGVRPHQCSVCSRKFTQKGDMNRHMILHTGEKPYHCSVCAKSFARKAHLQYHMGIHTGERPYKCLMCDKTFIMKYHLSLHMRTHAGERPYQCSMCHKTFIMNSHLSRHMRTHTGKKPYECSDCSKKFTRNHDLIRHMILHTGEKPYQCSVCAKSFARKAHLQYHMGIHTEEQPNKCSICDKTLITNSHLSRHMRTHTGEKPYECLDCSKRFTRHHDLIRHMRTHTGVKLHQCSVCKKKFNKKNDMNRHMRTHTGERPYKCSICDKTFIRNSHLSDHIRTHTGERPYQCPICNRRFTRTGHLKAHMRTHTEEWHTDV